MEAQRSETKECFFSLHIFTEVLFIYICVLLFYLLHKLPKLLFILLLIPCILCLFHMFPVVSFIYKIFFFHMLIGHVNVEISFVINNNHEFIISVT